MNTETRDKKIMIYNEKFKRFALADDGRTIELTGKKHSRIAIAGDGLLNSQGKNTAE